MYVTYRPVQPIRLSLWNEDIN